MPFDRPCRYAQAVDIRTSQEPDLHWKAGGQSNMEMKQAYSAPVLVTLGSAEELTRT